MDLVAMRAGGRLAQPTGRSKATARRVNRCPPERAIGPVAPAAGTGRRVPLAGAPFTR